METSKTTYDFYEDVISQMESNKPKPNIESAESIRSKAKLNMIGEGLRTVGEMIGIGQGAPVERRGENQNVLQSLAEFNALKAKEANDEQRYQEKLLGFKLNRANAKAAGAAKAADQERADKKHKADQDFIREENDKNRGIKGVIADKNNDAKKYAVDNKKVNPKTPGKKIYNPDEDVTFDYKDETGTFKKDTAKARTLKGIGLSLANLGYKELYTKYPTLSTSIEALQNKQTQATDEDYINLGATIWNDVKDKVDIDGNSTGQPTGNTQQASFEVKLKPNITEQQYTSALEKAAATGEKNKVIAVIMAATGYSQEEAEKVYVQLTSN